jgi:hypothetical protein
MGRIFDKFQAVYDPTMKNINKVITKHKSANLEMNVLYDAFNSPDDLSPYSGVPLTKPATMDFEPVSLGELRLIKNNLNTTLAGVIKDFYMIAEENIPYHITLRSTAIRISTKGRHDDHEYFRMRIGLKIQINSIRRGENPVSNLSVAPAHRELPLPGQSARVEPVLDLRIEKYQKRTGIRGQE